MFVSQHHALSVCLKVIIASLDISPGLCTHTKPCILDPAYQRQPPPHHTERSIDSCLWTWQEPQACMPRTDAAAAGSQPGMARIACKP